MLLIKRRSGTVTFRHPIAIFVGRVFAPTGALFIVTMAYAMTLPENEVQFPAAVDVALVAVISLAVIAVAVGYYWRRLGGSLVEIDATRLVVKNPRRCWELPLEDVAEVAFERRAFQAGTGSQWVTVIRTATGEEIEPFAFGAHVGWIAGRMERSVAVLREEIATRQAALPAAGARTSQ